MGNALLAYPDETRDSGTTISGGSWLAALPLANLKTRLISQVARTTNALATSTLLTIAYPSPIEVRVIALLNHNITLAGTVRVRGYSDSGLTTLVHDTGTQFVWPQRFTIEDVGANPNNWIFPCTPVTAQYWKVEIIDTANGAGYVELGRCWLGPAWQPNVSINYGADIVYEPRAEVTESAGGTLWFSDKKSRRVVTATFPELTPSEKRTALLMQKNIRTTGELIYVQDITMVAEDLLLHAFCATPRRVPPIRAAFFEAHEMPIELVENIN